MIEAIRDDDTGQIALIMNRHEADVLKTLLTSVRFYQMGVKDLFLEDPFYNALSTVGAAGLMAAEIYVCPSSGTLKLRLPPGYLEASE